MMQITLAILWIEHYFLNEKQVGFVFMFMGLSSAIVQGGLVGLLNKKFGEKQLLMMGTISMGIGLLSIPFVPPAYFLLQLISIVFVAFANGCITPAITSLISQAAAKNEQGQVLGMNQSFGSLARVIGPVLGGILYDLHFGLPYAGGALIMVLTFLFVRLLVNQKVSNAI
jgi:MFS family permease